MPKSRSKRGRRQPPPKTKPKRSPAYIAALFFTLLATGVAIIIGNYVGLYGPTDNVRLYYGLGLVAGAFVVATRWH
jgi:hypothetical protein